MQSLLLTKVVHAMCGINHSGMKMCLMGDMFDMIVILVDGLWEITLDNILKDAIQCARSKKISVGP